MIELKDLGLAYRKAKVDLYYSSHASLEEIADYEENLHENLLAFGECQTSCRLSHAANG